ncbi:unnamed protein product [Mycena citricolor]|uniref:Uncharacterized protein n=1 Tax=Mycena citricolor TaxID=2018698 RepID=A0AAD2Q6F9_9AGAR|nr:unnamed protein product [Mycena citricolor]
MASYAAVTAHNAPSIDQQPKPDPALLNTAPPQSSPYIDITKKVNIVPPPAPAPRRRNRLDETKAESIYLLDSAKHYLLRPGVAGGLIGLVNIGLMAGTARAFYVNPHYRRDTRLIYSTVAAALGLLGLEGFIGEAYRKTPAGQEEERKAKEEGAVIYRHAKEQILRPGVLGGLVGMINLGIIGGISYYSYLNWNKPWDRRVVSALSAGLCALSVGEGFLAEQYRSKM